MKLRRVSGVLFNRTNVTKSIENYNNYLQKTHIERNGRSIQQELWHSDIFVLPWGRRCLVHVACQAEKFTYAHNLVTWHIDFISSMHTPRQHSSSLLVLSLSDLIKINVIFFQHCSYHCFQFLFWKFKLFLSVIYTTATIITSFLSSCFQSASTPSMLPLGWYILKLTDGWKGNQLVQPLHVVITSPIIRVVLWCQSLCLNTQIYNLINLS